MANIREETLNTCLALLLDRYDGIRATAEMRSASEAIDITVTHARATVPIPILIEAKIGITESNRRKAARQARDRLSGSPQALAFGLCYPKELRDGSISVQATHDALAKATMVFAPVRRADRGVTWREGSVSDFADSLRNIDLSRRQVTDSIEHTVREAAESLLDRGCASDLAVALALPRKNERDLRAAALIGSLILSNAALLHQRLGNFLGPQGVAALERALDPPERSVATVREAWDAILEIDYHPVFSPGLAVLNALSDRDLREPLHRVGENAVAVADDLASLRFDHAGPLYHRLLSSAKYDGSFYTSHVSALLLARLALTEGLAHWSDADELASLKVIDPACGTGTLLMAAMHTMRDRHENAAAGEAESDLLHLTLVEDVLYGLDINRHGIQLAACNLTLGNPRVDYRRMNLFTMQHGPQSGGGARAGSLEFLATARGRRDIARLALPLPTASELDAERAEPGAAPSESLESLFDLVIMNPPFTRNDIRNRQYGKGDRDLLRKREIEIARTLEHRDRMAFRAIDQTSVESFFTPLADILLKDEGATLAMVVPTTSLTGASSLHKRRFLAERFQIETVITSHDPARVNFSDSTSIHESLVVARRPGPSRVSTRFVALARMPVDTHEAILLSDKINRQEEIDAWGSVTSWPWPRVREGNWTAVQYYDGELAEAVQDLAALAGTRLIPAGEVCHIGPEGRRVRDAFYPPLRPGRSRSSSGKHSPWTPATAPTEDTWTAPILWDHSTQVQTTMIARADVLGIPKLGRESYARKNLAKKASRLLIVNRLRTNTVRVSSCYAPTPLLGSAWTPVRPKRPDSEFEMALCAWWNSTPGILTMLSLRAKSLDYPRFALEALRSLLVPSPGGAGFEALAQAFRSARSAELLPWPRMIDCPTRALLDEAAARALRIDGRRIAGWRDRIAREPTVSGHAAKGWREAGPPNRRRTPRPTPKCTAIERAGPGCPPRDRGSD